MRILKKAAAALTALALFLSTPAFASSIPDHCGTDISDIEIGTMALSKNVTRYNHLFKQSGDQYGIDPNILAAICMQESSGINYDYYDDGTPRPAWGIMQIEYTCEQDFAAFGLDYSGVKWTLEDRLDPEKAVPYAAHRLSEALYKYDNDYAKMLQSYNYSDYTLKKILDAVGDDWMDERVNAVDYVENWPYENYGDPLYVEHVLRYYHNDIEYIGAKVRLNNKLVKFNDQYPIVDDGYTLIPVRAVSESLGAKVDWDGKAQLVTITKGGTSIKLYIDNNTAYINGSECELDMPAQMINNRTMVPLRFVAETFDLNVDWDGNTRTVIMTD